MKKTPESESFLSAFFLIIVILLVSGLATARKAKKYNRITQASLTKQTPWATVLNLTNPKKAYTFPVQQNFTQAPGRPAPISEPIPVVLPAVKTNPSPGLKMLPFQEAHWQGLELIPLIPALARILRIPVSAGGVIVDDVTAPADLQGFQAGDLITSVGQISTPDLISFINATDRVRDRQRTEVQLIRNGKPQKLLLISARKRLGIANGEAAPMIKPGSRSPHNYQGPCTECHRIGSKGQLALDQGDLLKKKAPPILAEMKAPHRDRGECAACHKIKR